MKQKQLSKKQEAKCDAVVDMIKEGYITTSYQRTVNNLAKKILEIIK